LLELLAFQVLHQLVRGYAFSAGPCAVPLLSASSRPPTTRRTTQTCQSGLSASSVATIALAEHYQISQSTAPARLRSGRGEFPAQSAQARTTSPWTFGLAACGLIAHRPPGVSGDSVTCQFSGLPRVLLRST